MAGEAPSHIASRRHAASSSKRGDLGHFLGLPISQQAAWSGATFWINGAVVDTNANWGDQQGTGYGVMTGSYRIAVGGPTYISASTSWGAAWGDFTINLHATKE